MPLSHDHMALNTTKSNSIIFSLLQQTILDAPLNINGEVIDKVNNVKLLGVALNSHLRFLSHFDIIIQKVRPFTCTIEAQTLRR